MEISFHSHLDPNTVIATKFCTWHDSCAVVACAKICCDLIASSGITARRSFHQIWIAGKKSLVKRAPVPVARYTPPSFQITCAAIVSIPYSESSQLRIFYVFHLTSYKYHEKWELIWCIMKMESILPGPSWVSSQCFMLTDSMHITNWIKINHHIDGLV